MGFVISHDASLCVPKQLSPIGNRDNGPKVDNCCASVVIKTRNPHALMFASHSSILVDAVAGVDYHERFVASLVVSLLEVRQQYLQMLVIMPFGATRPFPVFIAPLAFVGSEVEQFVHKSHTAWLLIVTDGQVKTALFLDGGMWRINELMKFRRSIVLSHSKEGCVRHTCDENMLDAWGNWTVSMRSMRLTWC